MEILYRRGRVPQEYPGVGRGDYTLQCTAPLESLTLPFEKSALNCFGLLNHLLEPISVTAL